MVEGGCCCGAVRYRLTSAPIFVNCCHCRDCQRLSGSSFALNGMIEADRVELIDGNGGTSLDVREGSARCAICGVLLWAEHPMFGAGIRFVRLGTLDESEAMRPDAHFFVRSKHPWIVIPEDVARYETLPGPDAPLSWSAEAKARVDAALGG